jgi:hypothetical protein
MRCLLAAAAEVGESEGKDRPATLARIERGGGQGGGEGVAGAKNDGVPNLKRVQGL